MGDEGHEKLTPQTALYAGSRSGIEWDGTVVTSDSRP